jgi:hypothetical protein
MLPIWHEFYAEAMGILYVVDTANPATLEQSAMELSELLQHPKTVVRAAPSSCPRSYVLGRMLNISISALTPCHKQEYPGIRQEYPGNAAIARSTGRMVKHDFSAIMTTPRHLPLLRSNGTSRSLLQDQVSISLHEGCQAV